ncbi:glycine betaine ABC transporter substrate-binding protein [Methanoplanus endosymbiosus]|uniref:Glycine betaine ABC transporter substrate-binding protein n=1 Tax=Methanoplanus endosymbiosus TaxID=33865 RepID=A0A9E7THU8_9EURY|nr:glycine betaine ABC transporter substrate-binding protein [Methanoplanus endosymbiosus]UUX91228.1 glycine betaine ABC transporter substrate-binding protein [Methanoplanus endosymbiosus]
MEKLQNKVHCKSALYFLTSLILAACLLSAGCTDGTATVQEQEPGAVETVGATPGTDKEKIALGMPNWPGVTVKTHVVKNILESEGYDVEIVTRTDPGLIYTSMAEGDDVDVLLGAWLPTTQKPYWDKYQDKLELISINVNETWLGLGVPDYVYEAGIHSIPDLKDYADEFGGDIVTLEAGNGMTIASENSIKEYGLEGFTTQISNTSAMLDEVMKAEQSGDWIVFCAWEPHYMMNDYKVKKLEDPKALFGNNEDVVYTVARKDFGDDYPWVYQFLKKFQIPVEEQSLWIAEYGKNERDPDDVAKEWIENNPGLVQSWMP